MPPPVTPQYLLEGSMYALEQCGLLLRDAITLYERGSFANTVVLAAFAREELGRFNILLELRRQVLAGNAFAIQEIQDRCSDHVTKQQAGMVSTLMEADRDSVLGKLIRARWEATPQSPEWKAADEQLTKLDRQLQRRVPHERHERRQSALYIEPASETEWNRPANTSRSFAFKFLQHAVNDYSGRFNNGYSTLSRSLLKQVDLELYNALEQWTDCPELPAIALPHDPAVL